MRQNAKYLTLFETSEERLKSCVLLKIQQIKKDGKWTERIGEIEKDSDGRFYQVLAISDKVECKRKKK